MIPTTRRLLVALCGLLTLAVAAAPQTADEIKLGIAPIEPFRIIGNIYYVGSADLTSYLIVTPEGSILLDSGLKEMVPQVRANVEKLGFRFTDIRIILNSHAHTDHAGGIAEIRRLTGARFLASHLDAPLLERGGKDDPNFGDRFLFEPTKPDETFGDGRKVRLGSSELTANITSGHTAGCTTWTMTAKEKGRNYRVLFLCSLSAPGYKLVGNDKYPNIVADYTRTFAWLKRVKVDVFLGSHAGFFGLEHKARQLRSGRSNPFIGATGLKAFIANSEKAFVERLNVQRAATK